MSQACEFQAHIILFGPCPIFSWLHPVSFVLLECLVRELDFILLTKANGAKFISCLFKNPF